MDVLLVDAAKLSEILSDVKARRREIRGMIDRNKVRNKMLKLIGTVHTLARLELITQAEADEMVCKIKAAGRGKI